MARQLKGSAGVEKKESKEVKQKRKEEALRAQKQLWTIAIPTLLGILALVFMVFMFKANSVANAAAQTPQ